MVTSSEVTICRGRGMPATSIRTPASLVLPLVTIAHRSAGNSLSSSTAPGSTVIPSRSAISTSVSQSTIPSISACDAPAISRPTVCPVGTP